AAAGDAPAFSDEAGGGRQTLTWAQARQRIRELAAGFAAHRPDPGGHGGRPEPDPGLLLRPRPARGPPPGAAGSPYAPRSRRRNAFVAGDCDARIAVLDGAAELARWQPVLAQLPGLQTIIVRNAGACPAGDRYLTWDAFAALGAQRYAEEPGVVTGRVAEITMDSPVALLYTSG